MIKYIIEWFTAIAYLLTAIGFFLLMVMLVELCVGFPITVLLWLIFDVPTSASVPYVFGGILAWAIILSIFGAFEKD